MRCTHPSHFLALDSHVLIDTEAGHPKPSRPRPRPKGEPEHKGPRSVRKTYDDDLVLRPHGLKWPDLKYCYFIREPLAGCIKIGIAWDVNFRLESLQAANPYELTIVGICPGGKSLEAALHKEFADDRLLGEWFRPSQRLTGRISALCCARSPLTPFYQMRGNSLYKNGRRITRGNVLDSIDPAEVAAWRKEKRAW